MPLHRLLERDSDSRLPAAVDAYERGVSLSGMSKAFGMPGIRIGWLALKDADLMRSLQQLHDYSSICSSAPSEVCSTPMQGLLRISKYPVCHGIGSCCLRVTGSPRLKRCAQYEYSLLGA